MKGKKGQKERGQGDPTRRPFEHLLIFPKFRWIGSQPTLDGNWCVFLPYQSRVASSIALAL